MHFANKDFSKAVRKALAKNGIAIIGTCTIPGDGPMPYANGARGYQIDDNGTGRIKTYTEMRALGGEPCNY